MKLSNEYEDEDKAMQQQLIDQGLIEDGLKPWQRGAVLRDEAIERVDRNASATLKQELLTSVRMVAEQQLELTSDDVWANYRSRMKVDPHEHRVLGAVMRKAAQMHWIVASPSFVPSVRPETHRSPKRVWHSLILKRPR